VTHIGERLVRKLRDAVQLQSEGSSGDDLPAATLFTIINILSPSSLNRLNDKNVNTRFSWPKEESKEFSEN
jgi:hypothetical protein